MRLTAGRHLESAFQAIEARVDPPLVNVGAGQQHTSAHELEVEARRGRAAHVGEALGDDLGSARELAAPQPVGLGGETLPLVGGDVDQAGGQRVRHRSHDDEVAQAPQEVFGEAPRILTDLDDLVDAREDAVGVAGGEGVHDLVEQAVRGVAQQRRSLAVTDARRGGATQQLVEHRQRVTHRAGAGSDDER